MSHYAIGLDFGTLSCRALLADTADGKPLGVSVFEYPHAVLDRALPTGERLGQDWALQHPSDYLEALRHTVPELLASTGVDAADVVGIGADFTACTLLPVQADGTPLCLLPNFSATRTLTPSSGSTTPRSNRPTGSTTLHKRGGNGGWEITAAKSAANGPFQKFGRFSTRRLRSTPRPTALSKRPIGLFGSCAAGRRATAVRRDIRSFGISVGGILPPPFSARSIHGWRGWWSKSFGLDILPLGSRAGGLTPKAAKMTGLRPGTAVAVGNVDAHVCLPAVGIDAPGKMLAIMGTSTCHIMLGEREIQAPGICGVVEDGVMPGYFGYESGQGCVGDHFAWFIENCLPSPYLEQARAQGESPHAYLRSLASRLRPGESGLVALDWWNGCRSVLMDADLTGLMVGMTLHDQAGRDLSGPD